MQLWLKIAYLPFLLKEQVAVVIYSLMHYTFMTNMFQKSNLLMELQSKRNKSRKVFDYKKKTQVEFSMANVVSLLIIRIFV